jgi:hypothetical protein
VIWSSFIFSPLNPNIPLDSTIGLFIGVCADCICSVMQRYGPFNQRGIMKRKKWNDPLPFGGIHICPLSITSIALYMILQKYFSHPSLVIYFLFRNPTHYTKTRTANRWETTNSKPSGRIVMIDQLKIRSSSQINAFSSPLLHTEPINGMWPSSACWLKC